MPFVPRRSRKRRAAPQLLRDGGAVSLSDPWRAWLAENIALGVADADLLGTLQRGGVPRPVAAREIAAIRQSPLTLAASRLALRLGRRELVARLQRAVAATSNRPGAVDRRAGVSREEFFERYYAGNVPVVLTDALAPWPRLAEWSPAHFKERFGHTEVEVMTGRSADPACDSHFEDFCTKTRLDDFCDRVTSSEPTNDFYLVAKNGVTHRPALKGLLEDVAAPHEYLDDRREAGWTSVWFGPPGTFTPLHHDTANVLFCQVFGRKRFLLVAPFEVSLTDDMHHGVYTGVDVEASTRKGFPTLEGVSFREVVLSPGEALFLPVGWWHQVTALDVCISLAFTAFRIDNQFDWYYPGKVGLNSVRDP